MTDYLYDGTFDGYLTAIFHAYAQKQDIHIYKEHLYNPTFFADSRFIATEPDKADRVFNSILTKLSASTLDKLYYLHLSCTEKADTLGLRYLRLCYHYSDQINLAKNNEVIAFVDSIHKQIFKEVHRFYGFVRFKEVAPLHFYAVIEPDNNILPLIMGHFKERFSDQYFIIHDLKRKTAIVYDTTTICLRYLSEEESFRLTHLKITDPYEQYFKTYYQSATIQSRINPRQQNAYMPKRYYRHLVEV